MAKDLSRRQFRAALKRNGLREFTAFGGAPLIEDPELKAFFPLSGASFRAILANVLKQREMYRATVRSRPPVKEAA